MNKNVLITGGAGFIGSHLALELLKQGFNVRILDNLSEQIHGPGATLPTKLNGLVEFIPGDVRNKADWIKALENQHVVVHLAAETGTGQSMYEIQKYVDVNINGTALLLDHLVNNPHSVEKVIVASSRSIYGEGKYFCFAHGDVYPGERREEDLKRGEFEPKCPICAKQVEIRPTDENSKIHPSSIYGITKQNQEQMVLNVCRSIDLPAVAFRYQNVYGPGQSLKNPYTGILSIFSTQIRNGNNINIFEDGKESRDFVFIDDVVRATALGITNDAADFHALNVGSGLQTSVLEVAGILNQQYEKSVELVISGNFRLGDIRHNYADLTTVKSLLGFTPAYDFNKGAALFAEWVRQQEIEQDKFSNSIQEMKSKGLFK